MSSSSSSSAVKAELPPVGGAGRRDGVDFGARLLALGRATPGPVLGMRGLTDGLLREAFLASRVRRVARRSLVR